MHSDSPSDAERRHQEFVRLAVKYRAVWALRNDVGFANWSDDEEEEPVLPLWSDQEAAAACARKTFPGYQPERIGIESLLTELLPEMSRRKYWVGTNLTPSMTGIDLPAEKLRGQLEKMLAEPGGGADGDP